MSHSKRSHRSAHGRARPWLWRTLAGAALLSVAGVFGYRYWVEKKPDPIDPPTKATGQLPARLGPAWSEMDDASKDGWDTEVVSAEATKTLKKLSIVLSHPSELRAEQLSPFVAEEFTCGPLLPPQRQLAYEDALFQVTRKSPADDNGKPQRYRGARGFLDALMALSPSLSDAKQARWFFKVFRIEAANDNVTTRQYVSLALRTKEGMIEQNATWVIRWAAGAKDESLRLRSIEVTEFEQVGTKLAQGTLFTDCGRAVLKGNDCYEKQFLLGMNHWFQRIQDIRYFALLGLPGLAVGDVNGDGLDDLYVCQEESLPNRLFLQQPDGTARDASAAWQVDWLHGSRSALLVDLDNDGDQDLVVAIIGHLIVASNEGARFKVRAILPTDDDNTSLSAADFDNDGDLDLYVCAYFKKEDENRAGGAVPAGATASSLDLGRGGGRNVLYRNELSRSQRWQFVDVTEESGLDVENRRYSFAAAWEDYDNDGDQDLYVANDYGRNCFYRNDDGRFKELTIKTGVADSNFGMSVAWGDYDQDGWMDLYVSNMFSAAGNRVTFQEQFQSKDEDLKTQLQRFARGNTLLRNQKNGTFADVSETAAVTIGRWAWGSNFVDVNNDSREDLVVANGYLTTDDTGDL